MRKGDFIMDITTVAELTAALESMDPALIESALAGLGFVLVAAIAFVFVRYLMRAIGLSAMYRKAGEAGWKAFIPVFNTYNNFKISWTDKKFFLYAALIAVSTILGIFTEGFMAEVATFISISVVYMTLQQNVNMAKLFGKGIPTGIALAVFPGITSLALGLGKAEFQK